MKRTILVEIDAGAKACQPCAARDEEWETCPLFGATLEIYYPSDDALTPHHIRCAPCLEAERRATELLAVAKGPK